MHAMPTILITGSSGFIGSSLRRRFEEAGWDTIGVGRRATSQSKYYRCDLAKDLDFELERLLRSADVVVHAAARSSPWGTRRQFFLANVRATKNLIDACEKNGRPRLVYVSSSSVYYEPRDQIQITESTPQAEKPINRYAASKQLGEKMIREYSGGWVILRPRAVYGRGDTVLFPRILKAAKAGRLPLLTRPGPVAIGDLISIQNLCEYFLIAANDGSLMGDYNLTDNEPVEIHKFLFGIFDRLGIPHPTKRLSVQSAHQLAAVIEWVYGWTMPWLEPPITRFGVHVFAHSKTFDIAKTIADLGHPKFTTAQCVDDFVSWIQQENPYGA